MPLEAQNNQLENNKTKYLPIYLVDELELMDDSWCEQGQVGGGEGGVGGKKGKWMLSFESSLTIS